MAGKHGGSRRAAKPPRRFRPRLAALALAITALVVAWGYLVYAAIDFGSAARGGERSAWWLLALACLGAVACLFIGLMLVARALRELGVTPSPGTSDRPANTEETPEDAATPPGSTAPPNPPRPSGGRRAAR